MSRHCRREYPAERRDTRRDVIRGVVEFRGGPPESQVARVLVAHHTVHRVDSLVGEGQRRAAKEEIQQRRGDAVAKVLRDALHGGADDAVLVEFVGVAPDNPRHRLPRRAQVVLAQLRVYVAALAGQSAQG